MKRIPYQTIVEHNGQRGVTTEDFMNTCLENETPVVFYGEPGFVGIETSELTIIGPENAQVDLAKCGAGRHDRCCKFIAMGDQGFSCQRFGPLRFHLILADMNAKRTPGKAYPECQDLEDHL